jgi:hypothetical protein
MNRICTKIKYTALGLLLLAGTHVSAQRINTHNDIGWGAVFGNFAISKRFSVIPEFQWRRTHVVKDWQQLLIRGGVQYNFEKGGSVALLYAFINTYPYGDYPAGPHDVPEHRITEQAVFNGSTGIFSFTHRLRLEQRYLGRIDQKGETGEVEEWIYANRFRYMLRAEVPVSRPKMADKTFYLAAYDELFIGFGRNVKQNVFDQNRLAILAGYRFNKNLRVEAGYLNQIVQQSGEINNQEVFQYNEGPLVHVFLTK